MHSDGPAVVPSPTRRRLFGDFDPQPLLEVKQKDLVWSGGDDAPVYQQYLGQMELTVCFNNGLLTVHSKSSGRCT